MKQILLLFLTLFFGMNSYALNAKVAKVKGRKAIVIFSERGAVEKGDTLYVSYNPPSENSSSMSESENFKHSIVGGFDVESVTYDIPGGTDIEASRTQVEARFGWVKPKFEVGPIFIYGSQDFTLSFGNTSASFDIKSVLIGGYGEYNFDIGQDNLILAAGGIIGHTTNELGSDVSGFRIEPYGRLKYFIKKGAGLAALAQLGYRYDELSGDGVDVSGTGFVFSLGLGYYF